MSKNPEWLPQVRDFCRDAGIKIMAWGPEALVVEAKCPEVATRVSLQLRQLGFEAVEDEADRYAGVVTLLLKP